MRPFVLSNGVSIPVNGFGVYQISKEDTVSSVLSALKAGYRHIDTAEAYLNEEEVGEAIRRSGVPREELFITTKIWIDRYGEEKSYEAGLQSLRKLGLEYVDLLLLHQPLGDYYGAYRALERLYEEGKAKSIGVSNFQTDRLVDLCLFSKIRPMVNQIEINPFHQREEDKEWADKYGVLLEAWAPFAEGRNNMFGNETLVSIADKHGRSVAQVILRWLYQRGIVSLAKSVHENRIKENFDIESFSLDESDMEQIKTLERGKTNFFDHRDPKMVEWLSKLAKER